jgi:hypothetical protein
MHGQRGGGGAVGESVKVATVWPGCPANIAKMSHYRPGQILKAPEG